MSSYVVRGVDTIAVSAAALSLLMIAVYMGVMRDQDDQPALWVLAVLAGAALLDLYGSSLSAPHRRFALGVATAALFALGGLAILTIGLPILLAAGLSLAAATRSHSVKAPG